jgi:hypothetical protein
MKDVPKDVEGVAPKEGKDVIGAADDGAGVVPKEGKGVDCCGCWGVGANEKGDVVAPADGVAPNENDCVCGCVGAGVVEAPNAVESPVPNEVVPNDEVLDPNEEVLDPNEGAAELPPVMGTEKVDGVLGTPVDGVPKGEGAAAPVPKPVAGVLVEPNGVGVEPN